jgi:putative adenylate-forming enzyme
MADLVTLIRVFWTRRRLEKSCAWSRTQLEAHHARQLASLRRFALERSPFYRQFHKGLENRPVADLPILTKATMMESFDDLITDRAVRLADAESHLRDGVGREFFRGRYVVLSTSGSTGRRGVFLFDQSEWIAALANIARPMVWAGIGMRLSKSPRAAMIASRTSWHYSARVTQSLSNRLIPSLHLDAGEPLETMVRKLNEWQPSTLTGYPSALRPLAGEQLSGRLGIRLYAVGTSAEVLTDETRRRIQQAWGVPVFDTYGATEYAPIAAECSFGRKHLVEDGALIEVVDDRGRPVPPGERGDKVLLTVFGLRTQPLIRYELSDVLRLDEVSCECGRPFRVLASIEGRVEEVLTFGAVSVHPNLFHELLETVPAAGWQVIHDESGLKVNLTGLRDASVCESLGRQVRGRLESLGVKAPPIDVRPVDALERGATGKAPLVMRGAGC